VNSKYLNVFFVVILGLSFYSCTTTEVPVAPENPVVSEAPLESPEEVPAETLVKTRYLKASETVFFADNTQIGLTVYTYDAKGRELAEEHYDANKKLIGKKTLSYISPVKAEWKNLDSENKILGKGIQSFDDKGNLVKEVLTDSEDKVQSSSEYTYNDAQQVLSWAIYNPRNELVSNTMYEYAQGDLQKVTVKDAKGTVIASYAKEWKNHSLVKESEFDSKKKLVSIQIFTYANDKLATIQYQNALGTLKRTESFEYDEAGNLSLKTVLNDKGRVQERVEYTYKVFTEEGIE